MTTSLGSIVAWPYICIYVYVFYLWYVEENCWKYFWHFRMWVKTIASRHWEAWQSILYRERRESSRCKDSFRVPPCGTSTVSALDFYCSVGNTKEEVAPAHRATLSSQYSLWSKLWVGGACVYFVEAISIPFPKTRAQLFLQMNISEMDHLAIIILSCHTTKEHWNIEEYTARLYRLSLSSFTHEKLKQRWLITAF